MASNLANLPSSVEWNYVTDFVVANQESDGFPINPPNNFKMKIGQKSELVPQHVVLQVNNNTSIAGNRYEIMRLRLGHLANNTPIGGTTLWIHLLEQSFLIEDLSFVSVWCHAPTGQFYSKCANMAQVGVEALAVAYVNLIVATSKTNPKAHVKAVGNLLHILFQPTAEEVLIGANLGYCGSKSTPKQDWPPIVDLKKPSLLGHLVAALLKLPPCATFNYVGDVMSGNDLVTQAEFNASVYDLLGVPVRAADPSRVNIKPQEDAGWFAAVSLLHGDATEAADTAELIPVLAPLFETTTIRPFFNPQDDHDSVPFPPFSLLNILSPAILRIPYGTSIQYNEQVDDISGVAPIRVVHKTNDPLANSCNREAYLIDTPLSHATNLFRPPEREIILHVQLWLAKFKLKYPTDYGSYTTLSGSLDSNIGKFYLLMYCRSRRFTNLAELPPTSRNST